MSSRVRMSVRRCSRSVVYRLKMEKIREREGEGERPPPEGRAGEK